MAKKKSKSNPLVNGLILATVVGVPAIFALAAVGTSMLSESAPYILIAVIAVIAAIYNGMTCNLLYDYYEVRRAWYAFIPCFGELCLMDEKFMKIGSVPYVLAVLCLGASQIPYSVFGFLGDKTAINMPLFFVLIAFVMLFIVQIVKGIGLIGCVKNVSDEWEEQIGGTIGFIKSFSWLGFIPFVRVMAIYGLNKPLSTLVTFNDITVSDNDDVVLEEEEED